LGLGEVEGYGAVDVDVGHPYRTAFVFADGFDQAVNVHRVAGAQHVYGILFTALAEVFGTSGVGRYLLANNHPAEDLIEEFGAEI
jgi:hypothetical protein